MPLRFLLSRDECLRKPRRTQSQSLCERTVPAPFLAAASWHDHRCTSLSLCRADLALGDTAYEPDRFQRQFFCVLSNFFSSCCYPDGNFSWHHLWFLAYLFVFSILLLPAFLLLRSVVWKGWHHLLPPAAHNAVLMVLGLALLPIELLLRPSFPSTHSLIYDWANNLHYMWLMLAGAVAMARPDLTLAALRRRRAWRRSGRHSLRGLACSAFWNGGHPAVVEHCPRLKDSSGMVMSGLFARLWPCLSRPAHTVPDQFRRDLHGVLHCSPDSDCHARILVCGVGRCPCSSNTQRW